MAWQADLLHDRNEIARVGVLARRQQEAQGHTMGVTNEVDLGAQAASASSKRMIYRFPSAPFLPPPAAERVARIEVESAIQVSRSM